MCSSELIKWSLIPSREAFFPQHSMIHLAFLGIGLSDWPLMGLSGELCYSTMAFDSSLRGLIKNEVFSSLTFGTQQLPFSIRFSLIPQLVWPYGAPLVWVTIKKNCLGPRRSC